MRDGAVTLRTLRERREECGTRSPRSPIRVGDPLLPPSICVSLLFLLTPRATLAHLAMATRLSDIVPLLSLDGLRGELAELESGSFVNLTDEELKEKIRLIHDAFTFAAPIYEAGTNIFRAVRVSERPTQASRVSYPPPERVRSNGRLNKAGEVLFYGAMGQFASCLLECGHKVGEIFAVSAWRTKERMMFGHFGYSQAVFDRIKTLREMPFFVNQQASDERNKMIREWQSRVFTAAVPPNQEHLYRLPIALKNLGLAQIAEPLPEGPTLFSGVIYPSVAMWLLADNVAILPSEVDTKMELFEVMLLVIDSIIETPKPDGGKQTAHTLKAYDFAQADSQGNLIWGQKSRFVTSPTEQADNAKES